MSIEIAGFRDHNGFLLSTPFVHAGDIVVLSGLNGSGKTRLLESIQNGQSVVDLDGGRIKHQEAKLVGQSQLAPNFGGGYDNASFQNKISASLAQFDAYKVHFDAPIAQIASITQGRGNDVSLPLTSLYKLCNSIAEYLGKKPSQLTHDEIKIHFRDHIGSVLGFQDVSGICNQYIQRKRQNRANKYFAEIEGDDVAFLTDDELVERFGREPWISLNEILKATFDDKFYFSEPDTQSQSYTYIAQLIQKDSGIAVATSALSSGEKTLLWLALTLFNSQYYKQDSVETPKLLLLDEPDAFLHPKMVVKMYEALNSFSQNFKTRIILTTHSPTTIALAPDNSTYVVTVDSIDAVTKDEGIAELLDGVAQISINPKNRRQVFVESKYDADVYQVVFSKLVNRFDSLDPKILLSFISSGPKMPAQQLKDKVTQILKIEDKDKLDEFVQAVNGVGNCTQVIGQVEALEQGDNKTVRGIIDWDLKNKNLTNVSVLAEDYAYSIENITLDPVCLLLLLHMDKPESYPIEKICGVDVSWTEWLGSDELLQESIDRYIKAILGTDNKRDSSVEYVSGRVLLSDSSYLTAEGHPLEKTVLRKYPELHSFARSGKEGELKYSIVSKSMIVYTNGDFIPRPFQEVLKKVQR